MVKGLLDSLREPSLRTAALPPSTRFGTSSDFSAIQAALADDVTISLTGACVAEVGGSGSGQTLVISDLNNVTIEGPAALKHPVVDCTVSSPSRNVLRIENSTNIRLQKLTIDGGRGGVVVVDSTVRIQGGFTVQNSRGGGLIVTGAGGSDVSLDHQAVSDINSLSNNCGSGAIVRTGSRLDIRGETMIEGNGRSGVSVSAGARASFNANPRLMTLHSRLPSRTTIFSA